MTWPTDNSFIPLPTRFSSKYVFTSKAYAIESFGRFGEVEEIYICVKSEVEGYMLDV